MHTIHVQMPPCTLPHSYRHAHVCKRTDERATCFLHNYTIRFTHTSVQIPTATCKRPLAQSHSRCACTRLCTAPTHPSTCECQSPFALPCANCSACSAHLCSHSHPRVHTLLCTQPFAHCTHFHLSTPSCANCHIHVQRSSCTLSHGHGHAGECAKPCIHAQIPPCTLLGFHTHTHVCKTDRRAKTFLHTYTITQACKTTHPRANIPLHTMCKKHLARSHPCAHICTPLHMHRAMRKHIHVCNPVPLHTHVQTPPCTPLCVLHSCIMHHPCTPHDRTHVCKSTITHSTCIRVPLPLHTRVQTLPWPPPSADACNPVVQCFAHSHACKCARTAAHPRAKHPCAFPRSPSLHTHVHKSMP